MLETQHHPLFAGNEKQIAFILKNFPNLETIFLEGYNVKYSRSRFWMLPFLLLQLPRLVRTIKMENKWLQELVAQKKPDGIISDNRYGLFHKDIPSVILTHQLRIKSGISKTVDDVLQRVHYRLLEQFDKCWVVDVADEMNGLSGALAHPQKLPENAKYSGLQSQMNKQQDTAANTAVDDADFILVLLSGPEPQRTIFQELITRQIFSSKRNITIVAGSAAASIPEGLPAHIIFHKQLHQAALQPLLAKASMVVCRSGYSSLMDLAKLKKKAIIIPTPGQPEQEYLARHLHARGVFLSASQKGFHLEKALTTAAHFPFKNLPEEAAFDAHKTVLDEWLAGL